MAASQNEQQQWIKLPAAFSIKEITVESCEIATSGKLQRWKYAEKIFGEINNNKNIKVEVLIGANCLEALKPLEVIPSQDKGIYTFRTDLRCCVVGLIKAQQSWYARYCRISFWIEKKCEDFGLKKMLKKMYMIDFNEPSVRRDHPIIVKLGGISCKNKIFFEIMEKKTCKIGNHYRIPLPLWDEKISLPNNRSAEEKRLKYSRKGFREIPSSMKIIIHFCKK